MFCWCDVVGFGAVTFWGLALLSVFGVWGLIAFRLLGSVLRGFVVWGLCLRPFILFVFGLLGGLVVLRCTSWACCLTGGFIVFVCVVIP